MKLNCNLDKNATETAEALLKLKGNQTDDFTFVAPFISHGHAWKLFYQAKRNGLKTSVDARNTILIRLGTWGDGLVNFWVPIEVKPSSFSRTAGVDLSKPLRQTRFSIVKN